MIENHNSLAEKFIKKGFWLYFFSFIIAPIWYIIKIIISEELSVKEVWIIYWIISLITIISAYNDLWMTESINHFVPDFVNKKRYDKVKTILTYALIIQMTTWISIALFFFFWADFIANNYFKNIEASWILKVFAFFFLWINIFQIISTFFISIQNTFYNKLIEFFRMWFTLISVLFIFLIDSSSLLNYSYSWIIWLYIWILFALYFFIKNYYSKYLSKEKILWDKKMFNMLFKYSLMVFLWAQAATILSQIDMQMIIYMLWTESAWYYTNYLSIIWIPFVLIWPIFWLLFPIFSEMHSKKEYNKIKKVKELFSNNFLIIWIITNIFFFVFAKILAYILFWEKFIESWNILKYSILFLFFNFLLQINFNIMSGIWKVKERVQIISIAIVFNIIWNLILIKYIWVYWAALASAFGWILIWILSEIYLWKKFKINYDLRNIIRNIVWIWLLWIVSYIYIIPNLIIWNWNRVINLLYIFIIFIIWLIVFLIINKKEVKSLITEIKKLKNKS